MKDYRIALLVPLLLLFASTAHSVPISSSSGLSVAADVILDFGSGVPPGGDASSFYAAQGVVFSGATGTVAVVSGPQYGIFSGNHLASGGSSVSPQAITNALEIQFDGTVTAAAFLLVTNPGSSTFIASLGGTEIETYMQPTDYIAGNDWAGFEGIVFDTLRIEPGGANGVIHLDNLSFSGFTPASPPVDATEPTALALMSLGLLGFGLRGTRKEK